MIEPVIIYVIILAASGAGALVAQHVFHNLRLATWIGIATFAFLTLFVIVIEKELAGLAWLLPAVVLAVSLRKQLYPQK